MSSLVTIQVSKFDCSILLKDLVSDRLNLSFVKDIYVVAKKMTTIG